MKRAGRVTVISDDAVFSRMLELELSFRGYALSDKKNTELLIVDIDTYGAKKSPLPTIYFGRGEYNSHMFLHRPFAMNELFDMLEHAYAVDETNELEITGDGKISVAGEIVSLSDAEMSLLELLLDERGTPVSRERISAEIFPDAKNGSKVADVYICYLRKKIDEKLGRQYIKTVRGKGYMIK